MNKRQELGKWGEEIARKFLEKQGLVILDTNARTPYGELDIVAQEGDQVVFVEVKTRSSKSLGLPEESVHSKKVEHIVKSCNAYIQTHEGLPDYWRIDVVAILGREIDSNPSVEWFQSAIS
jgi:putative endonuclease